MTDTLFDELDAAFVADMAAIDAASLVEIQKIQEKAATAVSAFVDEVNQTLRNSHDLSPADATKPENSGPAAEGPNSDPS